MTTGGGVHLSDNPLYYRDTQPLLGVQMVPAQQAGAALAAAAGQQVVMMAAPPGLAPPGAQR